eukprot:g56513.t1
MTARRAPLEIRWFDDGSGGLGCGVFATCFLSKGYGLGTLLPGSRLESEMKDTVCVTHYRMLLANRYMVGMQPIQSISECSRNAMHLLNSGFHPDAEGKPTCVLQKHSQHAAVLSRDVLPGEEILLDYRFGNTGTTDDGTNERVLGASHVHPRWMQAAARSRRRIPVWMQCRTGESQIFFVVPEEEHPPMQRSESMGEDTKASLFASFCREQAGSQAPTTAQDPPLTVDSLTDLLGSFAKTAKDSARPDTSTGTGTDGLKAASQLALQSLAESTDGGTAVGDASVSFMDEGYVQDLTACPDSPEKADVVVPTGSPVKRPDSEGIETTGCSGYDDLHLPDLEECGSECRTVDWDAIKASSALLYVSLGLEPPVDVRSRHTSRPYKMAKRKRAEPKRQRPKTIEFWLGMTYAELEHEVRSLCCKEWKCFLWVDARDVIQQRVKSCLLSLQELKSSIKSMLVLMLRPNGTWQYWFQGDKVCLKMWMRIHGIGKKVMKASKRLVMEGKNIAIKSSPAKPLTKDVIGMLLCKKWLFDLKSSDNSDGVWKLQDITEKTSVYQFVRDKWESKCLELINLMPCKLKPNNPPDPSLVAKVWREEFRNVKPIRNKDFAKDHICTELAAECRRLEKMKDRGFDNEMAVLDYKRRSTLHHKIHSTCRVESMKRKEAAAGDVKSTTISSDMTPPIQYPACRRRSDDFKGKYVIRICLGVTSALLIRFQLDDGKVRDGAFITNVQLPSNKVVLGPQKSIETSEGVGEIMPAPGMINEFPQRWQQGLNQTKFNKMCKKHILVVRTVDATAIGGAVESRELQLLDKYFLSIGHTLALPDHKEDFEKDIMPLLKPYAGKPTEPPFLHRFRKKELLLAIQANKLKKAAGTRKSGRVKIDRSLADEVIEESPPKKNKKAGPKKPKESEIETLIRKASMTRLSRRRKRRRKKKTKKGKGDKEEEEKGGKEALGEAEGLSKLRADISNMSSSISQLVKTLQERPVVRVRRERVKKRRRLDDSITGADDSEEED